MPSRENCKHEINAIDWIKFRSKAEFTIFNKLNRFLFASKLFKLISTSTLRCSGRMNEFLDHHCSCIKEGIYSIGIIFPTIQRALHLFWHSIETNTLEQHVFSICPFINEWINQTSVFWIFCVETTNNYLFWKRFPFHIYIYLEISSKVYTKQKYYHLKINKLFRSIWYKETPVVEYSENFVDKKTKLVKSWKMSMMSSILNTRGKKTAEWIIYSWGY